MIGHWLLTLTPEEEDRILLRRFRPGSYWGAEIQCACLVGTACASAEATWERYKSTDIREWNHGKGRRIAYIHYEDACKRFGEPRVNVAIRNRILANQARRALQPTRVMQPS